MTREELEQFEVRVSGVNGTSGQCLYLNDHRVAGGKPWGGGVAVFEKTFKLGGFPDLMQRIDSYVEAKVTEIAKAYGGCTNCYGKGYATKQSFFSGRGVKWRTSAIKYCDCERGSTCS